MGGWMDALKSRGIAYRDNDRRREEDKREDAPGSVIYAIKGNRQTDKESDRQREPHRYIHKRLIDHHNNMPLIV